MPQIVVFQNSETTKRNPPLGTRSLTDSLRIAIMNSTNKFWHHQRAKIANQKQSVLKTRRRRIFLDHCSLKLTETGLEESGRIDIGRDIFLYVYLISLYPNLPNILLELGTMAKLNTTAPHVLRDLSI